MERAAGEVVGKAWGRDLVGMAIAKAARARVARMVAATEAVSGMVATKGAAAAAAPSRCRSAPICCAIWRRRRWTPPCAAPRLAPPLLRHGVGARAGAAARAVIVVMPAQVEA